MKNSTSNTGKIWDSLPQEQRDEVMLSYDESENEGNLLDASVLFLTDMQKQHIQIGLEQITTGKTISNEDLEKDEDEWLKE